MGIVARQTTEYAASRNADVSVIVPYWPDRGYRDRAFLWNMERLRRVLPHAELLIEWQPANDAGDFNRPAAINRAAHVASGCVLVIHDADTGWNPHDLLDRISLARRDDEWSVPQTYVSMTEQQTAAVLAERPAADYVIDAEPTVWDGQGSWSGIVVVPAFAFREVGGFDERYVGWGADDVAFAMAIETLYRPAARLGHVYHFWHPRPREHHEGHPHQAAQHHLTGRYVAAHGNREKMQAILGERWS